MFWKTPHKTKIYEALGCIGDKRIEVDGDKSKVLSSSKGKFYSISFEPKTKAIMSNDNSSYWTGTLGYPSVAVLMLKGVLPFSEKCAQVLKDIKWKDINQKFKNDFDKTEEFVLDLVEQRGFSKEELIQEVNKIYDIIKKTSFIKFGQQTKPPEGY